MKIQNRARIRMGELLRMIEKGKTGPKVKSGHPDLTRQDAAKRAGISPYQANEAKAMGRVPKKQREEMIERGASFVEK